MNSVLYRDVFETAADLTAETEKDKLCAFKPSNYDLSFNPLQFHLAMAEQGDQFFTQLETNRLKRAESRMDVRDNLDTPTEKLYDSRGALIPPPIVNQRIAKIQSDFKIVNSNMADYQTVMQNLQLMTQKNVLKKDCSFVFSKCFLTDLEDDRPVRSISGDIEIPQLNPALSTALKRRSFT